MPVIKPTFPLLLLLFLLAGCAGQSADSAAARSEAEAWDEARYLDTREAYEDFLREHPDGDYAATARLQLAEKGMDAVVDESTGAIVLAPEEAEGLSEASAEDRAEAAPTETDDAPGARARRQTSADAAEAVRFGSAAQVQAFEAFNQSIQALVDRGQYARAVAAQEAALEDFALVYTLSPGARLRAEFQLLDLYGRTYAYNQADILRGNLPGLGDAILGEIEASDLAATTTPAEPLRLTDAARPIFLGLVEPDPEILLNARGVQKVNEVNYTVKGYVHAYDGLAYFTINGDSVGILPNAFFRYALQLEAGRNPLYFEARSLEGSLLRDTVYLEYEPATGTVTRPPRRLVLAIALQDYPEDSGWPPLATPLADTRRFVEVMEASYGYAVFDTLFEARATLDSVVDAFKRLRFETQAQDDVVIYFAGHGRYDDEYTQQGYWVFRDREWSNSDQLAYLNRVTADDILLIADACFAGSFYFENHPLDPAVDRERARWVLASGRLEPVQDQDADSGHSPFAAELLGYLRQQQEPFSAYELGRYLVEPVYERSGFTQRPLVRPFSGDTGGEWMFDPVGQ